MEYEKTWECFVNDEHYLMSFANGWTFNGEDVLVSDGDYRRSGRKEEHMRWETALIVRSQLSKVERCVSLNLEVCTLS